MSEYPNILLLKDAYKVKIAALSDSMAQLRANVALDVWEKAEETYLDLMDASATQYTATGRTVTKRSIDIAMGQRNNARAELEGIIGTSEASVTYIDNGGIL